MGELDDKIVESTRECTGTFIKAMGFKKITIHKYYKRFKTKVGEMTESFPYKLRVKEWDMEFESEEELEDYIVKRAEKLNNEI